MRIVYTIALETRHSHEARLLTAMIRDAVSAFNNHLEGHAEVSDVRFESGATSDLTLQPRGPPMRPKKSP